MRVVLVDSSSSCRATCHTTPSEGTRGREDPREAETAEPSSSRAREEMHRIKMIIDVDRGAGGGKKRLVDYRNAKTAE